MGWLWGYGLYKGVRVQGLGSRLLKGITEGIIYATTLGVIKGDARSLDYSSYGDTWGHISRSDGDL